ncbi:NACHT domain-containing protein [Candidatus Poribacteria bacterium]|nr:NACHT domain-containing protein [Candidatus Poribacteria bacterium]
MEAQRSLDDVYVNVQFLNKRRGTNHTSLEDVEKALREKGRRYLNATSDKSQGGMRIATNEQYLMVLGGPGVGKSTFLRKVGLEALKGEDGSFEHESTPVFLELKRFTEDQIDIEAWIINEFKVCSYPYPERIANDKLEAGELLILFDGLDEVPKANVSNFINEIRDFVHQYSQNRFIISCRAAAYTGGFEDFTVVEIADFGNSQIQNYINNWFASAPNRELETAQRCWQTLNAPEHQAIKALAQNPLSLALLCTIYEDSQDFPSSQATLYERIFNIFLKKWPAEKHVHRDPPMSPYLATPTVKQLLSEIAAENFKADRLVFSEDELINQIQEFYQRRKDWSRQPRDLKLCCAYDFSLDSNFYKDLELYEDLYPYLYLDCYQNLYQNLDLDIYLYKDLYQDLDLLTPHLEFYLNVYRELYRDFVSYLYLNHDQALFFYHDFYRYIDRNFLLSIFSKFGDRFDRELRGRIELVKRIKRMKIFKGVDLQQIIQRFNAQREFIKAAGQGKSVEPPAESIHDTWLSVLGITNDMLEISDGELANYLPYLRGVALTVACKEAAGRVSPEVWQEIEAKLLTSGA